MSAWKNKCTITMAGHTVLYTDIYLLNNIQFDHIVKILYILTNYFLM